MQAISRSSARAVGASSGDARLNILENAIHLGKTWAVFPCLASKAPATPHGFKDASQDPDEIRSLWRKHPGPLIGVPTGERTGIDVLDLDPKNGCARWWEINAARVPETRIHQTRSGGWHLLFEHRPEVRNSQGKIGAGVDVRGQGGLIIHWPSCGGSIVSDAPIAAWPEWLIEKITYQPPRVFTPPATLKARNHMIEKMIYRALYRLETASEGTRHHQLRAAARTIGGLLDSAGISMRDAHQSLLAAVQRAGAEDMANADKTATYGLTEGMRQPWNMGG